MESIDILTGQHVTIKYEPASVVQRMAALILDSIFIGLYITALIFLYFNVLDKSSIAESAIISIIIILSLPILYYHVMFETLMSGKTPGKAICKIRVTNIDGSTPGFVAYFLRWLLLPIDILPYGGIGALCILFTKNHQRLGDLAAGTTVVKTFVASSKYDLDNEFYEFKDDYQPVYKEAELLSDGQISLISNLLQDPKNKHEAETAIEELAYKIKQKLNIKSELNDRRFLETIVKDYNYYATLGI